MIVWGGSSSSNTTLADGKIYDPETDTWTIMSAVGAPSTRTLHSAVWTGSKLIIWGGNSTSSNGAGTNLGDGKIYDPNLDTWTSVLAGNSLSARSGQTAIWTGTAMIISGGLNIYGGGVLELP